MATIRELVMMEDFMKKIHEENNGKCPGCRGKLAWKPLNVDVRPLGRKGNYK